MAIYYVNDNAQPNGDHEVHRSDGYPACPTPAAPHNQHALGWHQSCQGAVAQARREGYNANGCANCSLECHTG